jgi:hypothetical protein
MSAAAEEQGTAQSVIASAAQIGVHHQLLEVLTIGMELLVIELAFQKF